MTISPCSPSPTSRRKIPARPFHNTGMLARQTGAALAGVTARRVLRWLALRGSHRVIGIGPSSLLARFGALRPPPLLARFDQRLRREVRQHLREGGEAA